MSTVLSDARILLTGGSRGVGAATVRLLVTSGARVVFTYREKARRAAAVVQELPIGQAFPLPADLTNEADLDRLIDQTRECLTSLTGLVLNASGGLERDRVAADPAFALHLNRDAQVALVDRAVPLLAPGATVVFVTSHLAHFYADRPVTGPYQPVAASKHAGEQALRQRLPEFASAGLRLVVVSGDLIDGTITPRLLSRRSAYDPIAARRAQVGALPTPDDMAAAITLALSDRSLPPGQTIYVGSTAPESPRP